VYLSHREKREERKVAIITVLADKGEGIEPILFLAVLLSLAVFKYHRVKTGKMMVWT
jgi:hypothetical protein